MTGDQQPVGQLQGAAPQGAVAGELVARADRRVVEEVLLDCGQQIGERGVLRAGEGGVMQPRIFRCFAMAAPGRFLRSADSPRNPVFSRRTLRQPGSRQLHNVAWLVRFPAYRLA
jgi:hypothetical protein